MTQSEVIQEYGARLTTQANELTHRLKPKTRKSASEALFETAYLLIYLTLRPLREQWNLVVTKQTTVTLMAEVAVGIHISVCWLVHVDFDGSWPFSETISGKTLAALI